MGARESAYRAICETEIVWYNLVKYEIHFQKGATAATAASAALLKANLIVLQIFINWFAVWFVASIGGVGKSDLSL